MDILDKNESNASDIEDTDDGIVRPAPRRRAARPSAPADPSKSDLYSSSIEVADREEVIIKRYHSRIKNRGTAIRAFCVECMGGQIAEIRRCTVLNCALYPFRMGGNPFTRRNREARQSAEEE